MSGLAFVCDDCNQVAMETVARFCTQCKATVIAGYRCDCGYESVDPLGKEWGHKPHEGAQ